MADDKSKPQPSKNEQITDSLSNLSINTPTDKTKNPAKQPKKAVADSWDDESLSSDGEAEDATQASLSTTTTSSASLPNAPPPTPVTSNTQSSNLSQGASASAAPERRPEKTDAVARRMIAAGLGLKAPKRTEEQREYEKSVREKEKKRREQEKLAEQKRKEEAERAKAAVWDD